MNMVEMGMTGSDRVAGTSDDYQVQLHYQADCATPSAADIRVFFDAGLVGTGSLGNCSADIALSFPQPGLFRFHYSVVEMGGATDLPIAVNPGPLPGPFWDFGETVFLGNFDSGDTRAWSMVSP